MKPLLVVLGVVVTGLLATAAFGWWQLGSVVVGVAFCLAAGLRLVLPAQQVGDLAVRSRAVDAGVLLVLGFGLVALANTIPIGR
ncbi:MAG TPA: DUF3017 domain-containing protein [Mycobacteriales bacterium]|nr:DUF3017 domain-containing protein [Mycobacteriales bacterium]